MLETVSCHYCRSERNRELFKSTERVCKTVPQNVWCNIVRCENCGFIFLNPRVKENSIKEFYPETEYYTLQAGAGNLKIKAVKDDIFSMVAYLYFGFPKDKVKITSDLTWNKLKILSVIAYRFFPFRFRRILKYKPGGKLLEFGFGAGDYLCRMKSFEWECFGVEINDACIEKMQNNGIKAFSSLWDKNIPVNYFDWISSYHSVEHVYNPKIIVKRFFEILKPGGQVYLGLPNFDSFAARLFRSCWYDLGVPLHPHIFTVSSIRKMLEDAGFEILNVYYRSIPQNFLGSIQIAFNSLLGMFTQKKHTSMLLRDFKPARLIFTPLVKLIDILHLGDRVEVIARRGL